MTFTPFPKKVRIHDPKLLRRIVTERDGTCMYGVHHPGNCSLGKHPHHIINRGAGGDDSLENVITLCPKHHNDAHNKRITLEELRAILTEHYGYRYQ